MIPNPRLCPEPQVLLGSTEASLTTTPSLATILNPKPPNPVPYLNPDSASPRPFGDVCVRAEPATAGPLPVQPVQHQHQLAEQSGIQGIQDVRFRV